MSPFAKKGFTCWSCLYYEEGFCFQLKHRVSSNKPACGDFELN